MLRPKRRQSGPVVSLEQARLARLGEWVAGVLRDGDLAAGARLSRGFFATYGDFGQIMDLGKAGLLGEGQRLARVGYRLSPVPGQPVDVGLDDLKLTFTEMLVQRQPEEGARTQPTP